MRTWFNEIWQRRDLVAYLVRTDLKIIYQDKLLGFLWTLLDPLFMMLVYIVLVVYIFKQGGPQYPVLLFSVLLVWEWFSYSLAGSVSIISSKAKLIQVVFFPKAVLPLSRVLVGLVNLLFGLIVLIPMLFLFEAKFSWNLFWMPVLLLIQFLFTLGGAFLVATFGVYFRDLENILSFVLRMWFYLSPALYSISSNIPYWLRVIYILNPFAALFESYKNILVLGLPPNRYLWVAAILALITAWLGILVIQRKESDFAKDA
ncbi:ABC transporter permease [Candidatus Acetothermia bacterium]|nr:ABC transporter permease [Candidatus Acetothermia bacterium]